MRIPLPDESGSPLRMIIMMIKFICPDYIKVKANTYASQDTANFFEKMINSPEIKELIDSVSLYLLLNPNDAYEFYFENNKIGVRFFKLKP